MSANRKDQKRTERFISLRKRYKDFGGPIIACSKVCYPNKTAAKSALRTRLGNGLMYSQELMCVYHCPRCSAWHLGHNRLVAGVNKT